MMWNYGIWLVDLRKDKIEKITQEKVEELISEYSSNIYDYDEGYALPDWNMYIVDALDKEEAITIAKLMKEDIEVK